MDTQYRIVEEEVRSEFFGGHFWASQFSYLALGTLTAPLTTMGVSLQLSPNRLEKFYGDPGSQVSKLELAKSHELRVQERAYNQVQVSSGMVGSNRPFRAPYYKNYREVFAALAAQGYQGFFKGNGVDCIRFCAVSSSILFFGYLELFKGCKDSFKPYLYFSFGVLAELFMQPLHNIQSRYILQNRLPEFRLYKSFYYVFASQHTRLYQGINVIIPKQSLAFGLTFLTGNVIHGASLFVLTEFLTYPLDTVQRRLEVQGNEHSVLPRRYVSNIRWTLSRIYDEEGIFKGFYRGAIMNIMSNSVKYLFMPVFGYYLSHTTGFMGFARENYRD